MGGVAVTGSSSTMNSTTGPVRPAHVPVQVGLSRRSMARPDQEPTLTDADDSTWIPGCVETKSTKSLTWLPTPRFFVGPQPSAMAGLDQRINPESDDDAGSSLKTVGVSTEFVHPAGVT